MSTRRAAVLRAIAAHDVPFAWGEHDCATFAAAVVAELRGAAPVEPTWRTAEQAEAELHARGGLLAAITALLGPPYNPQLEQPVDGDVVLVRASDFEMAAVWAGKSPIGVASRGLVRLSAHRAAAGWRT